jgi:hypothetical protein
MQLLDQSERIWRDQNNLLNLIKSYQSNESQITALGAQNVLRPSNIEGLSGAIATATKNVQL